MSLKKPVNTLKRCTATQSRDSTDVGFNRRVAETRKNFPGFPSQVLDTTEYSLWLALIRINANLINDDEDESNEHRSVEWAPGYRSETSRVARENVE